MKAPNPTFSYMDILKALTNSAVFAAIVIGFIEAVVIVFKILSSNTPELNLIAGIVIFVSAAILLLALFMFVINLIMSPFFFLLFKTLHRRNLPFQMQALTTSFCLLTSVFFTVFYWFNYNSARSLFSGESILYNSGGFILAGVVAIFFYTLSGSRVLRIRFSKNGKPKPLVVGWAVLLIAALLLNTKSDARSYPSNPNVILLIVDTLRADRLGCYGYDRETTPVIDRIAQESVLFEQTYVQWASSLPSHSSIMTSMYPYFHGAFPNGKSLNPELQTLAKIFKAYGYSNGAFVSNTLVGNQYNFSAGYDTFTDLTHIDYRNTTWQMWLRSLNVVRLYDKLTNKDLFTQLALSWIEANRERPFFLWGQWLYPHAPYEPPKEFLRKFEKGYSGIADGSLKQIFHIRKEKVVLDKEGLAHYEALYDAEVAFSDYQIGLIFKRLRELNLLDNSIVIITADHGENLFEHDMAYGHAGVYDSSVRIPLVVRFPDGQYAGKRIPQVIESIDIAPTILEMLDITIPDQFEGRSLLPLIKEEVGDWASIAHSVMFREWRNFFGLRKNDWKIVLDVHREHTSFELYHIPSDPNETNNRYETEPGIAMQMKKELDAWLERDFADMELVYKPGGFFKEDFDEKTVERLRSLGYLK